MADTSVTVDCLETLQVTLHFASQIAFDRDLIVRDGVDDLVKLLRRQILRPQIWINVGLLENSFRSAHPDPVNVGERRFDPLIGRYLYSE